MQSPTLQRLVQSPAAPDLQKQSTRTSFFGGVPVSPSLARRLSRNETLRAQYGVRPKRHSIASSVGDHTPSIHSVSAGNSPAAKASTAGNAAPRVTLLLDEGSSALTRDSINVSKMLDFNGASGNVSPQPSLQIARKVDSLELSIEEDEEDVVPQIRGNSSIATSLIPNQILQTSMLLATSTLSTASAFPPLPRGGGKVIPTIEEINARRFRLHAWDKFLAEDERRVKLMRSGVLCGTDPLLP